MNDSETLADAPATETVTEQAADQSTTEQADETPEPSDGEKQNDATVETKTEEVKKEPTEAEKIKYAMQKRIDRQTARSAQIERELAEMRNELAKYRPQNAQGGAPTEDQFSTIEEYLTAKGAYEERQKIAKEQEETAKKKQAEEYARTIEEKRKVFEANEAEFRKDVPDYDERIGNVNEFLHYADPKSINTQVFRDFIMDSEAPAPVLYALGKDPDLMEKLASMNPVRMVRELTKIELQLAAQKKETVSAKPAPVTPIKGSSAQKSEDDMSGKELLRKHKIN